MSGLVIVKPVTETAVRNPQRALLPGRTAWIELCHERPTECPECLGRLARFLAAEMDHELDDAVNRPAAWYQAQIGERSCSLEQAADLRRLVVLACYKLGGDQDGDRKRVLLADLSAEAEALATSRFPVGMTARETNAERWMLLEREILRFRLRWLLVAILVLMLVA